MCLEFPTFKFEYKYSVLLPVYPQIFPPIVTGPCGTHIWCRVTSDGRKAGAI